MIEGALILFAGIAVGVIGDRLLARRNRHTATSTPSPMCACGHAIAFHNQDTQQCHALIELYDGFDNTEWVRCECQRYTGPEPLPRYYAPEISPDDPDQP